MKVVTTIEKVMYRNVGTGALASRPEKSREINSHGFDFTRLEKTARIAHENVQNGKYVPVVAKFEITLIKTEDKKVARKQRMTDEVYAFMREDKIYNYKEKVHTSWKTYSIIERDHFTSIKALLKAYSEDKKMDSPSLRERSTHRYNVINNGHRPDNKILYIVKVTRKQSTNSFAKEYNVLEKIPLTDFPEVLI
jgi:hypothetical protein